MTNQSILIGRLIKQLLESNGDLKALVGTKVFPIVADAHTTFPFIVYSRESLQPTYTKDGNVEDSMTVTVIAASDKYSESLEVANLVRATLERMRGTSDGFSITRCELTNVTEEFSDDTYVQRLTFTIDNK